ncbi:MAG: type II toxin-antitoxin system HicA family toxin [Methanomicrobiales archaeon]|jgi:predicted RNA binding protein YcfA (HicA-like mRNA interferase family)|nr:type II toxin-antitoxin system HicA family toxin [Methanomicrobiales archaeon]
MKLPRITGKKVIQALNRDGFKEVGSRGSHHYLYHEQRDIIVTVAVHTGKTLAPKTLKSILIQAGISVEEFQALL